MSIVVVVYLVCEAVCFLMIASVGPEVSTLPVTLYEDAGLGCTCWWKIDLSRTYRGARLANQLGFLI